MCRLRSNLFINYKEIILNCRKYYYLLGFLLIIINFHFIFNHQFNFIFLNKVIVKTFLININQ